MGYYINRGGVKPIPDKIIALFEHKVVKHNHVLYGKHEESYLKAGFEVFDHNCLYNADTVVFNRFHAVGDILMCIPVLRQMKKHYNIRRVILEFGTTKHVIEPDMFPDLEVVKVYDGEYDYYIDGENGLLEQDHSLLLGLTDVPRFTLYQRFLGLPEVKELDFSFKEDKSKMLFDPVKDKVVFLALYSTTVVRKLSESFVWYLAKYLNFLGYKLLFVDDVPVMNDIDAIYAHGKTTVQQAITNMKYCKMCITIDTGSLWFSHYAKVPTIVIAGSTPKCVRMDYHPLKKSGKALGVDMRKYCGCKYDCGGTGNYCLKHAICMNNFSYGKVLEEIATDIDKLMKVEKQNGSTKKKTDSE